MDAHNKLAEEQQKKKEIEESIRCLRTDKQAFIHRLEEVEKKRENGDISLSEYDAFLENSLKGMSQEEAINAYDELIITHYNALKQSDNGLELFNKMVKHHESITSLQKEKEKETNKIAIAFVILLLVVGASMFVLLQMGDEGTTGMAVKDTSGSNNAKEIPQPPISPPNPNVARTVIFGAPA